METGLLRWMSSLALSYSRAYRHVRMPEAPATYKKLSRWTGLLH